MFEKFIFEMNLEEIAVRIFEKRFYDVHLYSHLHKVFFKDLTTIPRKKRLWNILSCSIWIQDSKTTFESIKIAFLENWSAVYLFSVQNLEFY